MREGYRKLNMSTLRFKQNTIPMSEALKDVEPMKWKNTVYTGEEKILIDKQGIHYV